MADVKGFGGCGKSREEMREQTSEDREEKREQTSEDREESRRRRRVGCAGQKE